MKAIKIKMRPNCTYAKTPTEIDEIYIIGCKEERFYKKEVLHDYLKNHPGSIQVNIFPYPDLIPEVSGYGEKYVRSTPNSSHVDNLLSLPKV